MAFLVKRRPLPTMEKLAADYFGTLVAVRMPGKELKDIAGNNVMSHINLFRFIFADLSEDEEILNNLPSAISNIFGYDLVIDGKVQHGIGE